MSRRLLLTLAGIAALSGAAILLYRAEPQAEPPVAVAPADQDLPRYRAGGIELGVATVPDTPRVGANRLIVELPALAPGAYALRYRVLATDGHYTDNALRFRVRAER